MRVLVTGGAGFIGHHLAARLLSDGCEVVVLDNLHRGTFDAMSDSVKKLNGDVRDLDDCRRAMQGCGAVVHLAAQSNVIGSHINAGYAVTTNVAGTWNVLQAARMADVRHIVFASSREVYGDAEQYPVAETCPARPKNLYGATKVAAEALVRSCPAGEPFVSILRFANVIGLGDRDRVVPRWITAAASGQPLVMFGGDQILDFVSVEVAVDAISRTLALPCGLAEPVNIGSGHATTLRSLAERILAESPLPATVEVVPARNIEVRKFVADVHRMRRLLDLAPPLDPLASIVPMIAAEQLRLQTAAVSA